jgi:hypothetical protein
VETQNSQASSIESSILPADIQVPQPQAIEAFPSRPSPQSEFAQEQESNASFGDILRREESKAESEYYLSPDEESMSVRSLVTFADYRAADASRPTTSGDGDDNPRRPSLRAYES